MEGMIESPRIKTTNIVARLKRASGVEEKDWRYWMVILVAAVFVKHIVLEVWTAKSGYVKLWAVPLLVVLVIAWFAAVVSALLEGFAAILIDTSFGALVDRTKLIPFDKDPEQ